MSISFKERDVGELLSLTIKLSLQNFIKLALIALIFQIPALLLQLTAFPVIDSKNLSPESYDHYKNSMLAFSTGMFLFALFLGPFQQASMMQIVANAYTGTKASLGQCFSIGLRRFFPLFVFTFLLSLLVGFGLFLLIIPGIFFLVTYWVGPPALVVEGLSPIDAFKRSAQLTKGSRWRVLGFFLVLTILTVLLNLVFTQILPGEDSALRSTMTVTLQWAFNAILSIFSLVGPVVMYFQLRIQKENLDLQGLSDLVDLIGQKRQSRTRAQRSNTSPPSTPKAETNSEDS